MQDRKFLKIHLIESFYSLLEVWSLKINHFPFDFNNVSVKYPETSLFGYDRKNRPISCATDDVIKDIL